jgi:hypothetical protein
MADSPPGNPGTAGGSGGTPSGDDAQDSANLRIGVPAALELGWAMALAFGPFDAAAAPVEDRLPTEHELAKDRRIAVELTRIARLVGQVNGALATGVAPLPSAPATLAPTRATQLADDHARHAALVLYHQNLLEGFACMEKSLGLAYQLGRSLRTTARPPDAPTPVTVISTGIGSAQPTTGVAPTPATRHPGPMSHVGGALARGRIVHLQGWLTTLSAHLADDAAGIVGASLGRWSAWAAAAVDPRGRAVLGQPDDGSDEARRAQQSYARVVDQALHEQGDVWLDLLVGTRPTSGLLTPESTVSAGEAALDRSTRIVRKVVERNWIALVVIAVALAAVLFVALRYLGGAAKVWTVIISLAGTLGVTAKGISAAVVRLSTAAERPLYHAAEIDAMAWAATTLPNEGPLASAVSQQLRRSGIQQASPLGRH